MKPTTRIFAALGLILALLLNGQAHAVSYIHIDNAGAVNSYPSLADLSADTNSVFLGPGEVNGAFGNDPGFFYDSASGGYIHIDNAGAVNSYPSLPDLAADTNSVFLGPGEVNGAFGDDPGFFATPEPSSFVLAALGLIGLVVWRRRRCLAERC